MKTQLRLNSVVPHGVGSSPESTAIDVIYYFLLREFEQNKYSAIFINQVGDDLNEFVMKEPNHKVFVNIRYPVFDDFEMKTVQEQNLIRLDVVHTSLLRVAEYDGKFDVNKLEAIKQKILNADFSFDFVCKEHRNKKNESLIAKIIVHPATDTFDYYCVIEENERLKCKIKIYAGRTEMYYYGALFSKVKWKSANEVTITGKEKQMEISIIVDDCSVTFKNLTPYKKAPFFEMMRSDITKSERANAHIDWMHSLPPEYAANLREAHN